MKKAILTIVLLICSNTFMTFAWYGHLKIKQMNWLPGARLFVIIVISWGIAVFEYLFQVPANRIGFADDGGPLYSLAAQSDTGGNYAFSFYSFHIKFF
jgi:uncharacterized protein